MRLFNFLRDQALSIYDRYQRILPPLFFLGGFVWDSLTLRRIDAWLDNLILLTYLILLGVMIFIVVLTEANRIKKKSLLRYSRWYPLLIQFLLGGLFSAYVVFYFKSASAINTYIFLSILILLLIANEFLTHRLRNVYLLLPLYFLACYSFFIFFIPVVVRTVNAQTFIAAGVLSLGILGVMIFYFHQRSIFSRRIYLVWTMLAIGLLYGLMNVFYAQNWIPPVPLAMTEGGVYHSVTIERGEDGEKRYRLTSEPHAWYEFWKSGSDPFHYAPGDTVFCFVSIFAPTRLEKNVYHQWEKFNPKQDMWEQTDRIEYTIEGARDRGYRGYTFKRYVEPGRWRVNVRTDDGMTVGRINFEVVPGTDHVSNLTTIYR